MSAESLKKGTILPQSSHQMGDERHGGSTLPSLTTIGRMLRRRELTHRRTRRYTPKGKKYPELPALLPNQTHQVDMVDSCYITGPVKFYGLHAVDTAVKRRGIEQIPSLPVQRKAFWTPFMRFGCVRCSKRCQLDIKVLKRFEST